jgi:glycosyltransferase involved in cell wall biosynthesis
MELLDHPLDKRLTPKGAEANRIASRVQENMTRNLILVSVNIPSGLAGDIAQDRYPRTDFFELSKRLNASIISFNDIDGATRWLDKFVRIAFGRSVALALEGFRRRNNFDLVFTPSETIGMPLALFLKLFGANKKHLMIGHRLSPPKKAFLWKLLKLRTHISTVFVYSSVQKDFVVNDLFTPSQQVVQIPFMADQQFFRPMPEIPERHQVCSVGLEWRDYPTLIEAANGLNCDVKIAAGSLWSKGKNEAEGRQVPTNVDVRKYKYPELRKLYAESKIVVIPLYQTDFQAGITSILEAMAMGKPVIVTKTAGQTDTIIDGETGLYVSPGDPNDLRKKIHYLLENETERRRIADNGLRAFQNSFTLDHLVARIGEQAT